MATKKNTSAKTPKNEEKKVQQTAAENPVENERPQYKVPFISAKIDRFNDNPDAKIKANASVTIGNHFAVHGLKIYDGDDGKGPRVMYPATKGTDGKYYDDFHPVTKEAREAMDKYVLDAYQQALEQTQGDQTATETGTEDLDENEEPAFEQTM